MHFSGSSTAHAAIEAGLLVFPPIGQTFPGRGSAPLAFVVDSRGAGTNLTLRRLIVTGLAAAAHDAPTFDVIAGVAKAGTSWAAWLAWEGQWPCANVLTEGPRASGLQRQIEGGVAGARVLLVDNCIRSGESMRKAVAIVRHAGGQPVAALSIVRTGKPDVGVPVLAVWELGELIAAAQGRVVERKRP